MVKKYHESCGSHGKKNLGFLTFSTAWKKNWVISEALKKELCKSPIVKKAEENLQPEEQIFVIGGNLLKPFRQRNLCY